MGMIDEDECWGCVNYLEDKGETRFIVARQRIFPPLDPVQRNITPPPLEIMLSRLASLGKS